MRIRIVSPSQAFGVSAGMRIRYDRLKSAAAIADAEISVTPIDEFTGKNQVVDDIYIFAKTYTSHSYLLAHRIRQMGKLVGLDLFDDYFSQPWDPRLLRYRTWLASIGEIVDFTICSTPRLEAAVRPLLHNKSTIIIPDPSEPFDTRLVSYLLDRKIAEAARTHRLRILWFGIGDNPYFSVGLQDLVSFGHELAGLMGRGWSIELKVLTNKRALTTENLIQLRRLPVPFVIEEWSPERENAELISSTVCFLPVNGQAFSRAKSLNRAISALAAGCQVLCSGYPLYSALSGFVYSSSTDLLADLERREPIVRPETVPELHKCFFELANPYTDAERLISYLKEIRGKAALGEVSSESGISDARPSQVGIRGLAASGFLPDMGIIHGAISAHGVHKLANQLGAFSIKSPLCNSDWNFQVRFDLLKAGSMRVLVAEPIIEAVSAKFRDSLIPFGRVLDQTFYAVPDEILRTQFNFADLRWIDERSAIRDLTIAQHVMTDVLAACKKLFPQVTFYVSEQNPSLARKWELVA